MNKIHISIVTNVLLLSLLTGCNNVKPVSTESKATEIESQENNLVKTPSFKLTGIENGEVLTSNEAQLKIALFNFTLLDPETAKLAKPGEGHVHYWLDSDVTDTKTAIHVTKNPDNIMLKNLKPGEHTLTIRLVNSVHNPIPETITETIRFTVRQQMASASANPSAYPSATGKPSPSTSLKLTATPSIKPISTPRHVISTANTNHKEVFSEGQPSFTIEGIQNGSIVKTEDLKFKILIKGLQLVNYSIEPDPKQGKGHIHIWLDTNTIDPKNALKVYNDPEHIVIKKIQEGSHTMKIGLVSNDHKTLIGSTQTVSFTVKRQR